MGGSISLESIMGEGSCFTIELSISESVADKIPAKHTVEALHVLPTVENKAGHTILYVEDNPANLRLVEQILFEDLPGIDLLSAPHAEMGLDLARAHRPSLILMDINLPGMDGRTAFKKLRSYEETRDIPVIAISANAMKKDIEKTLAMGFQEYLVKPIDPVEFLKVVETHLAQKP